MPLLATVPFEVELSAFDLASLGLVLAIVGCFLLANSIVFRHPRTLVSEFFGQPKRRLTTIRSYIFHRVQIHLGFLFLLAGFGLQLFGRFVTGPAGAAGATDARAFPVPWIGVLLFVVVVLELAGWWLSHALFRRYVREYFRAHPPRLEADMELARELGELFGIPSVGDDSVPSYLLRIRQRIGVLAPAEGGRVDAGAEERGGTADARRRERLREHEEEFGIST